MQKILFTNAKFIHLYIMTSYIICRVSGKDTDGRCTLKDTSRFNALRRDSNREGLVLNVRLCNSGIGRDS